MTLTLTRGKLGLGGTYGVLTRGATKLHIFKMIYDLINLELPTNPMSSLVDNRRDPPPSQAILLIGIAPGGLD